MLKRNLITCSVLSAFYVGMVFADPPGKPIINWGEYKYALVEIDQTQVAYEKLVKAIHDEVKIDVSWNVWSGEPANVARVLIDDQVAWQGSAAAKKAQFTIKQGGRYEMVVELENQHGISRSEPKMVLVADTDGSHLEPLHHSWTENNKPYTNSTGKIVGTYFVEWSVFERNYPLDRAPLSNLNRIIYGFVPICGGHGINDGLKTVQGSFEALQKACEGRDDFKVAIHDPWAAIQKPQIGVKDYSEPYKGNFGQMMAAKKANPELKILPSIGGWTLSDPFFQMYDAKKRKIFVDSVREYLETWKFFDGVDIDFEFPGFGGANPSLGNKERDGQIYIDIMKDLRAMLDNLEAKYGREYELTSAINVGYDKLAVVDYGEAAKYMDNIYLMSYDFYGAWDNSVLNHQTGLHKSSVNKIHSDYYVSRGVDILIEKGVSPEKLVVGVAAFGRGWTGVSGYQQGNPFSGSARGAIKGTWENGVLDYRDIIENHGEAQGFEYGFDEAAQAPYLFKASTGDLITYDDVHSTKAKAQYVIEKGLGGIFHWEMDADNGDLINAMHNGLGHAGEDDGKPDETKPNKAPIARAGSDQTVTGPALVNLNGASSSDPEGGALAYQWMQIGGDKVDLQFASSAKARLQIPPVTKDATYTFKLTVVDPQGASSSDHVIVFNKAELLNKPPIVSMSTTTYVDENANFTLKVNASDPDGDGLNFSWSIPPNFDLLDDKGDNLLLRSPEVDSDSNFAIEVIVSDGEAAVSAATRVNVKNIDASGSAGNGCTGFDPNASKHPAWSESKVYTTEIVSHNNLVYKARWWVQGVEPSPDVEAWELLSDVELPWMAGVAYSGNAQIDHNGSRWQAKWWTKGDEPGVADVWVNVGSARCK